MKHMIITDLHFREIPTVPGYLDCQVGSVESLIQKESPDVLHILGDVFHNRNPSPTVLLQTKQFFDYISTFCVEDIRVLMGNHDAENKSDNGRTALSLFENRQISVITSPKKFKNIGYIPHYEDETKIREAINEFQDVDLLFGHWGCHGWANSLGNFDFDLDPDSIHPQTVLGHIHHFGRRAQVTFLGTPYTTQFAESGKTNYYAIFEDTEPLKIEYKETNLGPRHIVVNYSELDRLDLKGLGFVLIRILIDPITNKENVYNRVRQLKKDNPSIVSVDYRYNALVNEGELSSMSKKFKTFNIDEELITQYVSDFSDGELAESKLMEGYTRLKGERDVRRSKN